MSLRHHGTTALRSLAPLALVTITACEQGGGCHGDYCGTLVIAAIGQPVTLLPPVTDLIIDRDIHDQIFLKLADIGGAGNTVGDAGFEPQLADRWTWTDSLTLAFHIDDRARWHDGRKVTADDVAFTFAATMDPALDSPMRPLLTRIASVTAADSATAVFRFRERYPEMFFDAVYQMRVLPKHLLENLPYPQWRSAEFGRAPVGDGPYRFVQWTAGQSLELAADTSFFLGRPHLQRLIWRFNADLPVAVTQVVAGEADAIEVLVGPSNVERARQAPHLKLYPYASPVYVLMTFNLRERGGAGPHPVLGDADVRRALVMATDRARMVQSVFGENAKVPPGPIVQSWTRLWFPDLAPPPFDTAQAGRLLDQRGWRRGADGMRERGGRKLAFAIALPSSSALRRQYGRLIQEQLRAIGVQVTIEETDMPTLQDHLRRGAFDAAIQTWTSDPTPASSVMQSWSHASGSNFGHYDSPAFEREVQRASRAMAPATADSAWRAALTIFSQDAPAMMLAAPDNVAAVDARVADVRLRPDYYWAWVRHWRIPSDKLTERDRLER